MLIIYAHPNKDGHCGYILKTVSEWLDNKSIEYQILDLYQMNFNPVLKNDEHYTSGNKNVTPENKKIQELISNEHNFIFIYPTWWNNLPAILKGFIDRIFTPGFAFKYQNGRPWPLLKGRAVVFTATGAPWIYAKLFSQNRSIKVLTCDTLKFCGIYAKGFSINNANRLNETKKGKIREIVLKGIKCLNSSKF